MKLYDSTIQEGLTYSQAFIRLKKYGDIITRPDWEGYHFRFFDKYCIKLKTGEILMEPKEIYDMDKHDWMVVTIPPKQVVQDIDEIMKILKGSN